MPLPDLDNANVGSKKSSDRETPIGSFPFYILQNKRKRCFVMISIKDDMLLYAITDRSWLKGRTVAEQVEDALKGGATFIQLREKELDFTSFLAEAFEVKALCKKYNVPFVINDNVDIAVACDADGVHAGQSDMEAGDVRAKLGDNKIIGVSVHTVEEAVKSTGTRRRLSRRRRSIYYQHKK